MLISIANRRLSLAGTVMHSSALMIRSLSAEAFHS